MDHKLAKRIHLIYGCIASVLIIALAIVLMISCWEIYQSGDHPYTRESVGNKLREHIVLIAAAGAVILGGFLLPLLLPTGKSKPKALRDERILMKKTAQKVGNPITPAISREKKLRLVLTIVTAIICVSLSIFPLVYLFNKANFSGIDPTAEIKAAALVVLPPALLGLILCYLCSLLVYRSYNRQTAVYKQIQNGSKGKTTADSVLKTERKLPVNVIRYAGLALALALIIVGVFNGSAKDVLTKAIKICTECIGLG